MPITARTGTTGDGTGGASATVTLPGSIAADDFILIGICEDNNTTGAAPSTPPSGYTRLAGTPNSGSVAVFRGSGAPDGQTLHAYYKKAGSSESNPSYTCTGNSSWTCEAWSGVDTTTQLDVTSSDVMGTGGAGTQNVDCPSITTVTANTKLVYLAAGDNVVSAAVSGHTPPSGFTSRASIHNDSTGTFTNGIIADKDQAATGATGTQTGQITASSGNVGVLGYLLALRPASSTKNLTLLGVG